MEEEGIDFCAWVAEVKASLEAARAQDLEPEARRPIAMDAAKVSERSTETRYLLAVVESVLQSFGGK